MESLTWNKTDTDAVYAYMQEQERPAVNPFDNGANNIFRAG